SAGFSRNASPAFTAAAARVSVSFELEDRCVSFRILGVVSHYRPRCAGVAWRAGSRRQLGLDLDAAERRQSQFHPCGAWLDIARARRCQSLGWLSGLVHAADRSDARTSI